MSFKEIKWIAITSLFIHLLFSRIHAKTISEVELDFLCAKNSYHRCGLLKSIIFVESSNRVKAFNPEQSGSFGLTQVQCKTAKFMGFKGRCRNLFKPELNIKYSIKYLRYLEKRYSKVDDVIAAYNMGHLKKFKIPERKYYKKYVNHKYVKNVTNRLFYSRLTNIFI